jgi:hypothetical protein
MVAEDLWGDLWSLAGLFQFLLSSKDCVKDVFDRAINMAKDHKKGFFLFCFFVSLLEHIPYLFL